MNTETTTRPQTPPSTVAAPSDEMFSHEHVESFSRGGRRSTEISVARQRTTGSPSVSLRLMRQDDATNVWRPARTDSFNVWSDVELAALERTIARVREIQNELREARGARPRLAPGHYATRVTTPEETR